MRKLLFAFLLLTPWMIVGCNGVIGSSSLDAVPADYVGKTNPLGVDAVAAGAELFKADCANCHGDTGHGDGIAGKGLSPAPKNLAELQLQVGDDYLYWRINTGKEGTVMIPWKGILTDEQIWQIISFLHTLKP